MNAITSLCNGLMAAILIAGATISASAQDTTKLNRLYEQGLKQVDSLAYDEAIATFDQVIEAYSILLQDQNRSDLWRPYLDAKLQKGKCQFELGEFVPAKTNFRKAADESASHLGKQDSLYTHILAGLGQVYLKTGVYDSARMYHQELLSIQRQLFPPNHKKIANALNQLGGVYYRVSDYGKAFDLFQEALGIAEQQNPVDTLQMGELMANLGQIYEMQGNYSQAEAYIRKAIALFKPAKNLSQQLGSSYASLGNLFNTQGAYIEAKRYHKKSVKIIDSLELPLSNIHFNVYYNLSRDYNVLGDFDSAILLNKKAIHFLEELMPEDHPYFSYAYTSLGVSYMGKSDYPRGIDYLKRSLAINKKTFGEHHERVATDYYNIGQTLASHQKAYEEALHYLEMALKIKQQTLGENHLDVAYVFGGLSETLLDLQEYDRALICIQKDREIMERILGPENIQIPILLTIEANILRAKGAYEQSIQNLHQALDLQLKLNGPDHPAICATIHLLGISYLKMGTTDSAIVYLERAIQVTQQNIGPVSGGLSNSHFELGRLLRDQQKYEEAMKQFHAAIKAVVPEFQSENWRENPSLELFCIDQMALLYALVQKARAAFQMATNNQDPTSDLLFASETFQLALTLGDNIQAQRNWEGDRSSLLRGSAKARETLLKTNLLLNQFQAHDSLLTFCFQIAEQNKSNLLRQAWQEQSAQATTDIPDSLIALAYDLDVDISYYQKRNYGAKGKNDSRYEELLFQRMFSRDSLIQHFQTKYPAYYRLKYSNDVISVKEIQDLLKPEQTLLEYFRGDSSLFMLLIRSDTFMIEVLPQLDSLKQWVKAFREGVYGYYLGSPHSQSYLDSQYCHVAHQLYQALLAPIVPSLTEELTIIPDAEIGYVPFAAFLTKKTNPGDPLTDRPYLIRKHQISYAFSATLLREMQDKEVNPSEELLAVAPGFGGPEDLLADAEESRRGYLGPLLFNQPEAEAVAAMFDGTLLLDKAATREEFLRLAPDYRILHLSTHAKVNEENSSYSFLAFHGPADSIKMEETTQYGVSGLYLADLYNLKLNAEMVVLSACETGIGELNRGEGIASLARGFSYAGVKSILTTLWSVNDKATADLMEGFYQGLAEGLPKDQALRIVQLQSIKEGKSPFFWAGFVPMGDMCTVDKSPPFWWYGLILLLLVGAVRALIWFRNRDNSS